MKISKKNLFVVGIAVVVLFGGYLLNGKIKFPTVSERKEPANRTQQARELEAKIKEEGGITIAVTPLRGADSSNAWEFDISLDTHSGALDQDLVELSLLSDDRGNEYRPMAWEGDPPGGHHRKGILKFEPLLSSDRITLKIFNVGGVPDGIFNWDLKRQ